jgi:hypothetical protein
MLMMLFLLLLVFGFIHMCMLATTKYVVDFAAFSVARAEMVGGNRFLAAQGALAYLNWSPLPPIPMSATRNIRGKSRTGFTVSYRVPFGLPIFNNIPAGGIELKGFSPAAKQQGVRETGDNAQ